MGIWQISVYFAQAHCPLHSAQSSLFWKYQAELFYNWWSHSQRRGSHKFSFFVGKSDFSLRARSLTTSLGLPAAEHVRSPMHCHSTSFHCISSYVSCGDFLSIFTAHNNGLSEDLCRSPELFTVLIVTVVIATLLRCTVLLLQHDLYNKVMHLTEHCRPKWTSLHCLRLLPPPCTSFPK